MLGGALRWHLLGGRHFTRRFFEKQRRSAASAKSARATSGAKSELAPAEPATVKPYDYHMFVELPGPDVSGSGNSGTAEVLSSPWWPSVVEKEPALLRVFSRLAAKKEVIEGGLNPLHWCIFIHPVDSASALRGGVA